MTLTIALGKVGVAYTGTGQNERKLLMTLYEQKYREALAAVNSATLTLLNLTTHQSMSRKVNQDLWVSGEIEKLNEVSESITKHLEKLI